jgi:hypothetical protein
MVEVPTIRVGHLNATQIQALALADNRLHDQSNWNDDCLVGPRPRSVLTGKVAGEEDGDVGSGRGCAIAKRFGGPIMRRGSRVH